MTSKIKIDKVLLTVANVTDEDNVSYYRAEMDYYGDKIVMERKNADELLHQLGHTLLALTDCLHQQPPGV